LELNCKGGDNLTLYVDNQKIPQGNFSFLVDAVGNEELFKKFYDAEKNLKIDYIDFAHKIRKAYEAFALEEEAKRRSNLSQFTNMELDEIKEIIVNEIKEPSSIINYKNIIIDLCDGKEQNFADMLEKYSFVRHRDNENEVRMRLKKYIRFVYSFGSESSHENVAISEECSPNKENCLKVAGSFHDFLCVYYEINEKFDSALIPVMDYIPVPKKVVESMGLVFETGKSLYIKQRNEKVGYYIFSSDIESISIGQRRDIDTINKLWEDNFVDPSNIIRQTENITSTNGDYRFQVYALPNRPYKLSNTLLSGLSMANKLDIIVGICKGIESIHDYEIPMYHRNICPDSFYIFEIRNKYKPLLAKFDCTKDTAENMFTVFNNVEKRVKNKNTNQFFAPEVLSANLGEEINWRKADVFSLAKTILFILFDGIIEDEEIENRLEECEISDELKILLTEMLSPHPDERPEVKEILEIL
jgi:hypothetical protein